MSRSAQDILVEAMGLSEKERLELASEMISSVDGPPDADWAEAWLRELDRRSTDGPGAASEPWPEVRRRLLARLARR